MLSTLLHSSTFWLFVSMALFLLLAGKPAARFVVTGLDKRREAIRSELAEAERLRAEAQELLQLSQQQHRDAVREAQEIIADAKQQAAHMRADAATQLQQLLAAKEAAALAKLAEAEAAATREARELASELALAASRAAIRAQLSGAAADGLIDAAIADLPKQLAR